MVNLRAREAVSAGRMADGGVRRGAHWEIGGAGVGVNVLLAQGLEELVLVYRDGRHCGGFEGRGRVFGSGRVWSLSQWALLFGRIWESLE